ncbi:hypothetical protein [Tautonia marina]|uniref:hypothetical protein n=1 Tax=Tautonia marina TaxID=2653855 RepID=UPI001260E1E2|nr:hypothetical protein [Tautonia marina]
MSRFRIGLVVAIGLLAISPSARAQFVPNLPPGFGSGQFDPFSAYYGYYLPRNQAIAAQLAGGSNEAINLYSQARRANAEAARASTIYEMDDPYRMVPLEDRPYTRPPTVLLPGQAAGPAPSGYFGRSQRYFYGARTGAPGETRGASSARLPQSRVGGRMGGGMGGRMGGGMGGRMGGGMGGVGRGMGGFGGGFR